MLPNKKSILFVSLLGLVAFGCESEKVSSKKFEQKANVQEALDSEEDSYGNGDLREDKNPIDESVKRWGP